MLFLAALPGTVAIVLSFACTSRQKHPIQTRAFVDIYSIVCVSGLLPDSAVWHAAIYTLRGPVLKASDSCMQDFVDEQFLEHIKCCHVIVLSCDIVI